MNQLMGILLPSLICVKQMEKIYGEERKLKKILERYFKCVLFVNLIAYIVLVYIFKQPNIVFTYQFTIKYLLLSLVIAYTLPIIWKVVQDNVKIEIKAEKNGKKD